MPDSVDAFVKHLASVTDASERERLLASVKLKAVQVAPDEAFEPPVRTLGQYLLDPIELPPELVSPYVVVRGGVTCTVGRAGKGKTVMNLNRMFKWAAGRPFFDGWHGPEGELQLNPAKPLKTLIIENEGAGGLFHRQVGIMLHAEGYLSETDRDQIKDNLFVWGDGGYAGIKLDDAKNVREIRKAVEKWEPDIVFVEPFRGLWNGEENSATDMAVVIDALMDIASDYKVGIMLAHHERKGGAGEDGEKMNAARGSTVLEGAVSVMENFESIKGGEQRELTWSKSRHGRAPNPVLMEWDPSAWWYKHVATSDVEEALISALRDNADEPMSVGDLADATDYTSKKCREMANRMVKDGRLKKLPSRSDGFGSTGARYRLPSGDSDDFGGLSV